ncbi:MAG: NfeD family protein [Candidatus Caenarcaniphilales bacterium]|nr:NfeD family protein [Candidatus Caenarcaniphilales bacterium]
METHSYWYIFTGLLLLTEAFTPGLFVFVCLAFAAFVVAVIEQVSDYNFYLLVATFVAVSVLNLFTLRKFLKATVKIPNQNIENEFDAVGSEAMVFKPIQENEPGTIKLLDNENTLLAMSKNGEFIGQGTTVKVVELKDNLALVETF